MELSFPLSGAHTPHPIYTRVYKQTKKGGGILAKKRTEKSEINRLTKIFKDLPENQFAVAQGLIVQAARLRVRLDRLWEDIQENGETEQFSQSDKTDPYERERPAARLFTATDKNYQSVIKQLVEMVPQSQSRSKLAELMKDG